MDPGDLGKLFRLFLGLSSDRPPTDRDRGSVHAGHYGDPISPRDQVTREDEDRGGRRGFTVFTDPLEIHRFFEQQMDDMLRNFGHGFEGIGRGGGAIKVEPREEDERSSGSARDFMLKDEGQLKVDRDLDSSQVDMGELETLMRRNDFGKVEEEDVGRGRRDLFGGSMRIGDGSIFGGIQGVPGVGVDIFGGLGRHEGDNNSFIKSFGTSVVEKSTRLPSGGVETSRTVRNSDGTEVVTVTRKIGDQMHQQTTTTDRVGNSTTENKFTNIDDGGLTQFDNKMDGGGWQIQPSPREEMIGPPTDQLYNTLWNKFWGN